MKKFKFGVLVLAGLFATQTLAEFKNENLLTATPEGYVEGYSARNGNQGISEWVPEGQTVEDWQDMVTISIAYGGVSGTLADVSGRMLSGMMKACEGAQGQQIYQGQEFGYDTLVFVMMCPDSPLTNTPEWDLVKLLNGNDSLYIVQKAWTREPSDDEIAEWSAYLRGVRLCDTRLPDRDCPK